jgi:hypothetical protein
MINKMMNVNKKIKAEIRRIIVQGQSGQIVFETLS